MVAAFDYCLWGKGRAAPSIDTAMHGLVDAAHVDHLHPDAGIALATASGRRGADQGLLRRPGGVGAVAAARLPARAGHRRGQARASRGDRGHPGRSRHHRLGRHQRRVRGALAGDHRHRAAVPGRARPGRAVRPAGSASRCRSAERRTRAAVLAPLIRGLASTDRRQVGHYTDSPAVLDFLSRARHPALAALGTSCPDHFLRTKVRPMLLDLPPERLCRGGRGPAARAARGLPGGLPRLLRTARGGLLAADARRGPGHRASAGRRDVQLRRGRADRAGGGRVLPERDQRDARRRGGLRLPADTGEREVPDRVLGARGGQAAPPAQAQAAGRADRAGHRGRFRHRPGHRPAARRRGRLRGRGRP